MLSQKKQKKKQKKTPAESTQLNVKSARYIYYLIETSITVNWMVGIDKGKYT